MTGLTLSDIQRYEGILRNQRATLLRILRAELLPNRRPGYLDSAGDVHDGVNESVAESVLGAEISERELGEVRDVEQALARMRQGCFGICVDCGACVERVRLDVYPSAKRCIACKRRDESKHHNGRDATPGLKRFSG